MTAVLDATPEPPPTTRRPASRSRPGRHARAPSHWTCCSGIGVIAVLALLAYRLYRGPSPAGCGGCTWSPPRWCLSADGGQPAAVARHHRMEPGPSAARYQGRAAATARRSDRGGCWPGTWPTCWTLPRCSSGGCGRCGTPAAAHSQICLLRTEVRRVDPPRRNMRRLAAKVLAAAVVVCAAAVALNYLVVYRQERAVDQARQQIADQGPTHRRADADATRRTA